MQGVNAAATKIVRTSICASSANSHTPVDTHSDPLPHTQTPCQTLDHPPTQTHTTKLPTPVNTQRLNDYLQGYNHREERIKGFTQGFTIYFDGEDLPPSSSNSQSIIHNPLIIQEKIASELPLGHIAGPYDTPPFPTLKSSPLALKEKSEKGKFCLLHKLSYPYDHRSVNHNIKQEHATVQYATIWDAVTLIWKAQPLAYMAKADIADAF